MALLKCSTCSRRFDSLSDVREHVSRDHEQNPPRRLRRWWFVSRR